MKDKILTFIIGVLVGAIITAGVFMIVNSNKKGRNMGERPDMSQQGGGPSKDGNSITPPTRTDGDNTTSTAPTTTTNTTSNT